MVSTGGREVNDGGDEREVSSTCQGKSGGEA